MHKIAYHLPYTSALSSTKKMLHIMGFKSKSFENGYKFAKNAKAMDILVENKITKETFEKIKKAKDSKTKEFLNNGVKVEDVKRFTKNTYGTISKYQTALENKKKKEKSIQNNSLAKVFYILRSEKSEFESTTHAAREFRYGFYTSILDGNYEQVYEKAVEKYDFMLGKKIGESLSQLHKNFINSGNENWENGFPENHFNVIYNALNENEQKAFYEMTTGSPEQRYNKELEKYVKRISNFKKSQSFKNGIHEGFKLT